MRLPVRIFIWQNSCNFDATMNHLKPTFFSLSAIFLILLFPQMMTAQGNLRVTGSVRSSTGEPMPFVNVYVLSTMQGTTTNANGHFSVELSGPGEVDLVFQFVGYQKQIKRVSPGATVDVVLNEENVELPQFVVSANGRDPAYAIIEQAQAKRKEYLNQVDAYSAEVYLKGAARLNEIPENRPFLIPEAAMPDSTDLVATVSFGGDIRRGGGNQRFKACSRRMNAIVLDEVRLVVDRFEEEGHERCVVRAAHRRQRSVRPVGYQTIYP